MLAALYPPDHPYSWPTIGSMADLDAATRDDVADFFLRYYHPGNASLAIAGDFQPAEAKRLVEKYFGPIPAGPKVERLKPRPAELDQARRIRMTDRVGLARLELEWPTVPAFSPDDAALDVLAEVLAGGKSSRLDKLLVREKQVAQGVQAYHDSAEIAGTFSIDAIARPGRTLAEVEAAVREEVARIQAEPPTAREVAGAVNRIETRMVRGLESVGGFGGRADLLNSYNHFTGDPGYLVKHLECYRRVKPADVRRVARKYLGEKLVALEVLPGKEQSISPDPRKPAEAARREWAKHPAKAAVLAEARPAPEDADRTAMPQPGPPPALELPPIHRRRLSSGLRVWVVENHEVPTVNIHLLFPQGGACDPAGKYGLAGLMASVWDEGTQRRSATAIAEELADVGASLGIGSGDDNTSVRLSVLKPHLPAALEVFSDVLQHPVFPQQEFERLRAMRLASLIQIHQSPGALVSLAAQMILYGPEHPYGRFTSPSALRAIRREDLLEFYRRRIRPDQATAIVVGDVEPDEITAQLEKTIGQWRTETAAAAPAFPRLGPASPTRIVLVDRPGAPQSVILATLIGAERKSPDYYAIQVLNTIFGGQFTSRLNMNLREDKGYTYGARSSFSWRVHQPGPFQASSDVGTPVTAQAVAELVKELEGMRGSRPVTEAEMSFAKNHLTQSYPAQFETPGDVAAQLETLVEYGLPDDYFNTYVRRIRAVTAEEVLRAARKYLDLDHLAIIVVGDRAKIEKSLRALPIGGNLAVMRFDEEFRLTPVGL
jgi:zinc protease